MTTTCPTVSLDVVGEALVRAHDAVAGTRDEQAVEDALLALCRASYDVLLRWEMELTEQELSPRPEPESWRTPLDELRVQAALAEMELRDARHVGVRTVDQFVTTVSGRVASARHDVGHALDALRRELRKG